MRGWTRRFIINDGIEASRQQSMQHVYLMPFSCLEALVPDLMP
jgi:hypothetical protein